MMKVKAARALEVLSISMEVKARRQDHTSSNVRKYSECFATKSEHKEYTTDITPILVGRAVLVGRDVLVGRLTNQAVLRF